MTGTILPSRYTIRAVLGAGGTGRVFRVHDCHRNRDLALKVVEGPEGAFLRREFSTLRQIRHENLVRVFDFGSLASGEAYYSMELIEGGDWGGRIGRPQPEQEVRRILTGLLRGLAHLHCHREVHGDLKPGNILLGRGGLVKVSDVGMGDGAARAGQLSGTPGYAAPEIWEGNRANERSDLYAVGVMGYEALTGHHPFEGKTVRDVVAGQLAGWVPSPGAHGVMVGPEIERALMRASERDPALRFGTADEFMDALGVDDRIGEILGGVFVSHATELRAALEPLENRAPGTKTLLSIAGPPGIGKTAFLEELSARITSTSTAIRFADLQREPGRDSREASNPLTIATLDLNTPDECDHIGLARAGARASWAESLERNAPPRTIYIVACAQEALTTEKGPFEFSIALEALKRGEVGEMVVGMLGRISFPDSTIDRLHEESGGNPGVLTSLLTDLIRQGVIGREGGKWGLTRPDQFARLASHHSSNPWRITLRRLSDEDRRALIVLAMVASGLDERSLRSVVGSPAVEAIAGRLLAKGWTRFNGGRWELTSGAARGALLDSATEDEKGKTARLLLSANIEGIGDEARCDLALSAGLGVTEGANVLSAADTAASRGELRTAVARLQQLIRQADPTRDARLYRSCLVKLADNLTNLGEHELSLSWLKRSTPVPDSCDELDLLWHIIAGKAERGQGHFPKARRHFEQAIRMAEETNATSIELRAYSELVELEWNLGDERTRSATVAKVVQAIGRASQQGDFKDELAALSYGLGATLIRTGKCAEAKGILLDGYSRGASVYWRMRIANALSVAVAPMGDLEGAHSWIETAWELADKAGTDAFRPRILSNRGGTLSLLGRYREAAEADLLSAEWARRLGDPQEMATGLAGAAANQLNLAQYEEALSNAGVAERVASGLGIVRVQGRALEVMARAGLALGDLREARRIAVHAKDLHGDQEYVDLLPRLDWLLARIDIASGNQQEAVKLLGRAESALQRAPDLEDLWGIQVELNFLRIDEVDVREVIATLVDLAQKARESRHLMVELRAIDRIGEIVVKHGVENSDSESLLYRGLACAEESGVREIVWSLSLHLGQLAARSGETRLAQSRFAHALRVIREISGALSPSHRHVYLTSARLSAALAVLSPS